MLGMANSFLPFIFCRKIGYEPIDEQAGNGSVGDTIMSISNTDDEDDRDDDQVFHIGQTHFFLKEVSDSHCSDHTKEQDANATHYGNWNRLDKCSHFTEQAKKNG